MIADLGNGLVSIDGQVVEPMPGFPGPFLFATVGGLVYVAAGKGGGPRMAVYRRQGAVRLVDDFWPRGSADVKGRAGVVPGAWRDESIVLGAGFPVALVFQRPYPGDWVWEVTNRVALLFAGRNVQVRTTLPDDVPARYGVCFVGVDTANVVPGHSGYASVSDWARPDPSAPFRANAACVSGALEHDVNGTAGRIAHECGHAFGEIHDAVPGSLMNGTDVNGSSRFTTDSAWRIDTRTWYWR